MNQTLEKDIVDAIHRLDDEQLRDVKLFVDRLFSDKQVKALVTDEELDMLLELSSSKQRFR
ncbi:hypothetical protein J4N45_26165 [Vibrio sp. SCSIO 43140]|uniref:hypothetical protein n=1 Tax=Vibrio sp. SCSIO 43140 TaxID=2819100 RepID=UPI002074D4CB|nr:hypothetical protein [Vibrio sp. SCSIO 43140]USD62843.1 hypothetical protein J4N45_26165 [Vibrio sp. SCSIO 43140]